MVDDVNGENESGKETGCEIDEIKWKPITVVDYKDLLPVMCAEINY